MKYPRGRIVVFAKAPLAGQVKTRLAADLGDETACRLYRAMLEHTVDTATRAGVAHVVLAAYPDTQAEFFAELADRYPLGLCRQHGQDLGERMARATRAQLQGADFVILIGTDCVLIDKAYLAEAADRLAGGTPLVFGPADDGGYVLVGMSQPHTAVFEHISWGSAQVMAQSREQCRKLGLRVAELVSLFDIDTLPDWQRLQRHHPHIFRKLVARGTVPRTAEA